MAKRGEAHAFVRLRRAGRDLHRQDQRHQSLRRAAPVTPQRLFCRSGVSESSTASPAAVQTPVATQFSAEVTDKARIVRGFAVELDGADYRIGMVVACDRTAGAVTVNLFFGAFPVAQPVQASVRTASVNRSRHNTDRPVSCGGNHGPVRCRAVHREYLQRRRVDRLQLYLEPQADNADNATT